jgi:hypothetical protein
MMNQDELLDILDKRYSTDNKGDYFHVTTGMTAGIVVDTDDPLQMGRLRVFCPSHGDDPSKIFQLPWCVYVSPFGGTINSRSYERMGHETEGTVAYGFWSIPDLGANVLVGCIDGDLRRRYWAGVIFDQQKVHTIGNGRYEWSSGGTANGPLSSSGNPIEPAYSNAQMAYGGKNNSPEWQSREAEYSAAAISAKPTNSDGINTDQTQQDIAGAQQFAFNKDIVGGDGYDWSGYGSIPIKASKVFSWSTPGFASITMDDRLTSTRTRFRSASGHTIILDDVNERIYVRTNTGNAWAELDSAGNIDAYASRRISLNADMDININSGKTVRIQGKDGVYIYAGGDNTNPQMSEAPASGQVRIQSQDDMHLVSKNLRQLSFEDTIFEIGENACTTVGGTSKTQVQGQVDFITNAGDYNLTVNGDLNVAVTGHINEFSILGSKYASRGNFEFYSYFGEMSIGSQQNINMKSVSGGFSMESVGGNSGGTGGIVLKTPNSQISLSDAGADISTNGNMNIASGGNTTMQTNAPTAQAPPFPDESQVPAITCNLPAQVPIAGFSGADLAARVAWNAGFRGQSLTIAVAISGAESRFNPTAIGDVGLQDSKWGPSCGFWQVRSLVNPTQWNYPDTLRVKDQLFDPQYNANAAFVFSGSGKNFRAWSTYTAGTYLAANNMNPAVTAINNMCAGTTPMSLDANEFTITGAEPLIFGACPGLSSIKIGTDGISLQSLQDVAIGSLSQQFSTPYFAGVVTKVNEISLELNTLAYYASLAMAAISLITGHGINFPVNAQAIIQILESQGIALPSGFTAIMNMINSGLCINLDQIKSQVIPPLPGSATSIFQNENFNLNGGTIIP